MPGLVVFRRRWSVGSDDLVVPGAFLFTVHLVWSAVLAALLELLDWDQSVRCISLLWDYGVGYLFILGLSMLLELAICIVATRGGILDTSARALMPCLLYARLVVLIIEAAWLVAGGIWLRRFYRDCPIGRGRDLMLALVVSNGCVLGSIIVTVWCVYDSAGRSWVKMKKYQRSLRESESRNSRIQKRSGSRNRNWRQRKVIRAYQDSWDSRCRMLFCCIGKKDRHRNSFTDIARLLSEFFRDLDVVPSDVVAGLVLLRRFQKIERELIVKHRKNDTYEFLSGVPVTPRTKFLSLTEDGDLEHFQNAIHYMHFALAAYGWPLFLVNHSSGLCQLCPRLKCCCCGCNCLPCVSKPPDGDTVIVEDNCCQCNFAALQRILEVAGDVEVIYATFHVDVGETPFFVALDHLKKKVVISIRGTLSMKDVMTDLNAEAEVIPLMGPREDWLGHKGMVQAAEYIRKKLKEEGIITRAFEKDPTRGTRDYGLQLVGHSLGAGTAAILAILLKSEHPELTCFAFAPPGGLLSMPAQEYTQDFITSVVVGKDVVPRLGLRQMESLRADLMNAIKRSVDPKWKTITCSVVCCGCGGVPTSVVNLETGDCIVDYQRDKDLARSQGLMPVDSMVTLSLHRPLYPPGRIIHVVRHHPHAHVENGTKVPSGKHHAPVYQALWAGPGDFDEVLISPVMIQDHMPDNMLKALNKVITTLGPVKPQRLPNTRVPPGTENHRKVLVQEVDSEKRGLLSSPNCHDESHQPGITSCSSTGPPKRRRLYFETSFTSLQSPLSDEYPEVGRELSVDSCGMPWEYVASELVSPCTPNGSVIPKPYDYKLYPNWNLTVDHFLPVAPLAVPETFSEGTPSNPPSPLPMIRPIRRTTRTPSTIFTPGQEFKSNFQFNAKISQRHKITEHRPVESCASSCTTSETFSYECPKGPPPPVPRRRDSVHLFVEPQKICRASCCTEDEAEETCQVDHRFFKKPDGRYQVPSDNAQNLEERLELRYEFYERGGAERDKSDDLFSDSSSPEGKQLMAPAVDLEAEWKRRVDCGDASLPLLRGLSPNPQSVSPFFNNKRKKYVYPMTLVGRGESSV